MQRLNFSTTLRFLATAALLIITPEAWVAEAKIGRDDRQQDYPVSPSQSQTFPVKPSGQYQSLLASTWVTREVELPYEVTWTTVQKVEYFQKKFKQATSLKKRFNFAEQLVDHLKESLRTDPARVEYKKELQKASQDCIDLAYKLAINAKDPRQKRRYIYKTKKYVTSAKSVFDSVLLEQRSLDLFASAEFHLAKFYQVEDPEQKSHFLALAEEDLKASLDDYNELLKESPNDLQALRKRARVNLRSGEAFMQGMNRETNDLQRYALSQDALAHFEASQKDYLALQTSEYQSDISSGLSYGGYQLGLVYHIYSEADTANQALFREKSQAHCLIAVKEYDKIIAQTGLSNEISLDIKQKRKECHNNFREPTNRLYFAILAFMFASFAAVKQLSELKKLVAHSNPENADSNDDAHHPLNSKEKDNKTTLPKEKKPRNRTRSDKHESSVSEASSVDNRREELSISVSSSEPAFPVATPFPSSTTVRTTTKASSKQAAKLNQVRRRERRAERLALLSQAAAQPNLSQEVVTQAAAQPRAQAAVTTDSPLDTATLTPETILSKKQKLLNERKATENAVLAAENERQLTEAKAKLDARQKQLAESEALALTEKARADAKIAEVKALQKSALVARIQTVETGIAVRSQGGVATSSWTMRSVYNNFLARMQMVERRLGIKTASASTAFMMTSFSAGAPDTKTMPTQLKVNANLAMNPVVAKIPETFKYIGEECCGWQEVTGEKFYLGGGSARKFAKAVLANQDSTLNDLDVSVSADFKQFSQIFPAGSGYRLEEKPKIKNPHYPHKTFSHLTIPSHLPVTFCHTPKVKTNLAEDAAERDLTFNAIYIEFFREGGIVKAIIHDPTLRGLLDLMSNPPRAAFFGDNVKDKLIKSPIQMIRIVYQAVQLGAMISNEDANLIRVVLRENPTLLSTIEESVAYWLSEKMGHLSREQKSLAVKKFQELGIADAIPIPLAQKHQIPLSEAVLLRAKEVEARDREFPKLRAQ